MTCPPSSSKRRFDAKNCGRLSENGENRVLWGIWYIGAFWIALLGILVAALLASGSGSPLTNNEPRLWEYGRDPDLIPATALGLVPLTIVWPILRRRNTVNRLIATSGGGPDAFTVRYRATSDHLEAVSPDPDTRHRWDSFRYWQVANGCLYLAPLSGTILTIPLVGDTGDFVDFCQTRMAAHGVPDRRRARRAEVLKATGATIALLLLMALASYVGSR